MVELSGEYIWSLYYRYNGHHYTDGIRKMRNLLLFHDILVCAKQKLSRNHVKLEYKWYLPLAQLQFHPYIVTESKWVGLVTAVVMMSLSL